MGLSPEEKSVQDKLAALRTRRVSMIAYCAMKTDACDWHAVADAAMDLREIDAAIETLQGLKHPVES